MVAALGLVLLAGGGADAAARTPAHPVLTMSLNGVVDPFMASYLQRGISAANAEHDPAVAISIDTPGGLVSSMREIVHTILGSRVPVICYTPPGARAASAGTFIMFACPINGMAPTSEIGAAHPVGVSGATEQTKATNDAVAYIRSLARREGRNANWAEDAVRTSVSVDANAALKLGVVDYIAPSRSALLADAGGCTPGQARPTTGAEASGSPVAAICGAGTSAFPETLGERFFHSIADPSVAFILIDIAFVSLIVWAFHPGFHPPLALGIVSLALSLAILETLPVRLVGLGLLFMAAVLLVLDLKARAHGVLSAGGIVVFVLGGLLLFNPAVPQARVSPWLLYPLPVALGLVTVMLLRALTAARHEPLHAGVGALRGTIGVAEGALEPTGRVHVRGESWAAESVGGPVAAGAPVLIVGARGLTLEVQPEPVILDHGQPSPI